MYLKKMNSILAALAGIIAATLINSTFASVNLASGNYQYTSVDYRHFSEPELNLTRHYNSANNASITPFFAGGWGINYFSERIELQRDYQIYSEYWGPSYRASGTTSQVIPYFNQLIFPLNGYARYFNEMGEPLVVSSDLPGKWKIASDTKVTVTCLSPKSYSNAPVGYVRNYVGLDHVGADYTECGGLVLRWSDGREKTFALRNGSIYKLTAIKLSSGWSATLSYDAAGRLTTLTSITGRQISFNYDANGILNKIIAPGNVQLNYQVSDTKLMSFSAPGSVQETYKYSVSTSAKLLTEVDDNLGQVIEKISYDVSNRTSHIEKANGLAQESFFYTAANLRSIIDEFGIQKSYEYDYLNRYRLKSVTKPNSTSPSYYLYDDNNKLVGQSDFNGNWTSFSRDTEGKTVIGQYPNGAQKTAQMNTVLDKPTDIIQTSATTHYQYDTRGNVTSKTITADGLNRVWSYTYDSLSRLTSVTDPATGKTVYTYVNQALNTITNALGHAWTVNNTNAQGLPLQVTNPAGTISYFQYDAANRLIRRTVNGADTLFDYTAHGKLNSVTLPDGSKTTYTYNLADQLTAISRSDGTTQQFTLDTAGRPTTVVLTNAQGIVQTTRYQFSTQDGTLATLTDGLGKNTQFTYDGNGNVISMTDPKGRVTHNTYDEMNSLLNSTFIDASTDRAYDLEGNQTSVSIPSGQATNFTYNGFGQITQLTSPSTGTTSYSYSAKGLLNTKTDAKGNVATYSYDAIGRLVKISYSTGEVTSYVYDTVRKGELTSVTSGGATVTFAYDNLGLVNSQSQTNGSITKASTYSWDTSAKLLSTTTPSGQKIDLIYSAGSQLPNAITVNGTTLISNITWSPDARFPLNWTWSNSKLRSITVDAASRITGVNSSGVLVRSMKYDDAGNIIAIQRDTASTKLQSFSYDDFDRIASETPEAGGATLFHYDVDGNRTDTNKGGVVNYYSYDPAHLFDIFNSSTQQSSSFSYDVNGSLISDAARTFTYNGLGRLSSVKKGSTTTSYKYNGLGQRYFKTNQLFAYDLQGHLLGEYSSAGALQQEYVWLGDTPIAILKASGSSIATYYIHSDESNTPRVVTDTSNKKLWTWQSDAFGVTAPNEDPTNSGTKFTLNLRFPGQYYDKESGLHYNYFRDYDPNVGRYIESDPIGLDGGVNTFAYVDGNPMVRIDPLGLQSIDSPNATLNSAIARGDVRQIEAIMESLAPEQQTLARNALEKLNSNAADWIGKNCKGSVNREFPGQFRDKTLKEIQDLARSGNSEAKKAWKLLNDNRFKK